FACLVNIQEFFVILPLSMIFTGPLNIKALKALLKDRRGRVVIGGVFTGISIVAPFVPFPFGNPFNTGRQAVPHPLIGSPLIGLVGFTISPGKSIFIYSPPFVLGLLGTAVLLKLEQKRFAPIVACICLEILLVSTLKFWAGEWAW